MHVGNSGLGDLAAADGAVDAFDMKRAAGQHPRHVAALDLAACESLRRSRQREDECEARNDEILATWHGAHPHEFHFAPSSISTPLRRGSPAPTVNVRSRTNRDGIWILGGHCLSDTSQKSVAWLIRRRGHGLSG